MASTERWTARLQRLRWRGARDGLSCERFDGVSDRWTPHAPHVVTAHNLTRVAVHQWRDSHQATW